jgi:hypothetical protein
MITMFETEVRRCLARPLVRWLVAIAVLGCVIAGAVARATAKPASSGDQFRLVELWLPGADSVLGVGAIFLLIGGVVGGASMVGAEWRAGTFTTLVTWEPARGRVAVAKLLACGVVAAAIAVVLQVLFCAAFLPAAWGRGTTAGADREWLWSLSGAVLRVALLTGLAASLMASVAMIGRNTAAALGVAFGYLVIFENLVRAWKPWSSRFLLGPNGAVFVTGANLDTESFTRSTLAAALTLTAYAATVGLIAVASFWKRDVASSS